MSERASASEWFTFSMEKNHQSAVIIIMNELATSNNINSSSHNMRICVVFPREII